MIKFGTSRALSPNMNNTVDIDISLLGHETLTPDEVAHARELGLSDEEYNVYVMEQIKEGNGWSLPLCGGKR